MSALDSSISALQSKNTAQDTAIKKCINSVDTNSSSILHKGEHISTLSIEGQKLIATWEAVVIPEDLVMYLKKTDLVAITNEEIDAMF